MFRFNYILLFIAGFLISTSLSSQVYRDSSDCSDQISFSWVKTAGSEGVDVVNGICSDDDGNIYITGSFNSSMTFQTSTVNSAGLKDFFVAKLDNDGNLIWIESGGGELNDEGIGIDVDSDGNVYVTGNYEGSATFGTDEPNSSNNSQDIFIVKYDNSGVYQWGQFFGGYYEDISGDICVDNTNNPTITGKYNFGMYIPSLVSPVGNSYGAVGMDDFFIAKFDPEGEVIWVTDDGSSSNDSGMKITCDDLNNFYVTGEFSGTLNFSSISLVASGSKDVFFAKYSSSGVFEWAEKIGTTGNNDKAGDIAVSSDNKVYISSKLDQVVNQGRIYVYQSDGSYSSEVAFGGNGVVQPYGLIVDLSGATYVTGSYSGATDFGNGNVAMFGGTDYFVAKYKSDETLAFLNFAGSTGSDCGNDLCLDNSSALFVGGYYNNGISFEGTADPPQGLEDNMIIKYDSFFAFESIEKSSNGCNPNDMCLDVALSGGIAPFDYYLDGAAVSIDDDSVFNICELSVGEYELIATDANDCFIKAKIIFSPPTPIAINIETEYNICFNDTLHLVPLNADDYTSFEWSTGDMDVESIDVYDGGIYSLTVTDVDSCPAYATIEVSEGENKDFIVSTDTTICSGTQFTDTLPDGFNYTWNTGASSAIFTTYSSGEYSVIAFGGGCYYYDTINIENFDPKPTVNLGNDTSICKGYSIEFIIEDEDLVSYLWHDGSDENSFWLDTEELVSVTVTDINGCLAEDELFVSLVDVEQIELGPNASYCTNNSIELDPNDESEGNTYLWSNSLTTPTIFVTESGEYLVTVTNVGGCPAVDSITIMLYQQPIVDLGEDISFCDGGSDTIEVIGDFSTYVWNNGETLSSILVDASGLFSVTATDINGCFDSDTIIVFESELKPPFIGYDTTLCEDDIYRLEPMDDYYRYYWQNGTMGEFITITQPGTYSLTVTDEVGCTSSSTISIEYAENPYITGIDASGGQVVIYAMGGTEPYVYSYDGDTWQALNVYTLLPSDYYTFTVMDSNYCSVSIDAFLDATIDVPNFFTPNGDGFNDTWVISGLYQFPDAVIRVYDRYGKLLYEYVDNGIGWKGIYAGRPLPSDTYWYEIRLSSDRRPITGHVTIKR